MDDVTVKEEASTEESDYKKRRADERRRQFMASLLLKHATSLEGGTFLASGEILTAKVAMVLLLCSSLNGTPPPYTMATCQPPAPPQVQWTQCYADAQQ